MKSTLFSALLLFLSFTACQSPSSSEASQATTASSSTTAAASVVTLTVQEFAAQSDTTGTSEHLDGGPIRGPADVQGAAVGHARRTGDAASTNQLQGTGADGGGAGVCV